MSDVYAVRIKEHNGNEISAPSWPAGRYLRFKPEDHEAIGPGGFATYEPCEKRHASFGNKREAEAIMSFMKSRFPFVVCEIRRFVEAADAVG